MIARRLFLGGILAAASGPAIVRASSLMPLCVRELVIVTCTVRVDDATGEWEWGGYTQAGDYHPLPSHRRHRMVPQITYDGQGRAGFETFTGNPAKSMEFRPIEDPRELARLMAERA